MLSSAPGWKQGKTEPAPESPAMQEQLTTIGKLACE